MSGDCSLACACTLTAGVTGRPDQEEDGFLVVGDTASDRTAVHASTFKADEVDAPPQYGQVDNTSFIFG